MICLRCRIARSPCERRESCRRDADGSAVTSAAVRPTTQRFSLCAFHVHPPWSTTKAACIR